MPALDHICIDLETLSTRYNAVIVTIAAVKFSLKDSQSEEFIVNINPKSSKDLGHHIDEDTLNWWRRQNPEAVKAWQHSQISLPDAIEKFVDWAGNDKNMRWWCNSTNFDFPILESSMITVGKKVPWSYWMMSDMRTAYYLGNFNTHNAPRVGQYHNAIDDCRTQIAWLKDALGITV